MEFNSRTLEEIDPLGNWTDEGFIRLTSNRTHKPRPYDDIEALYDVPFFLVVLLCIFYGSISVVAVVGNALVMWIVATSRRMQNVTNCFIANLALADIVIGLFAIPFQFQAAILQRWSLPSFMCAFCPFVQVLSVSVSVFTLTAIAVDRHKAILDPLSAKPSKLVAKLIIGGIWLAGAAVATPMAIALRVLIVEESDLVDPHIIHRKLFCSNVHLSNTAMVSYRIVLFLLQYLTPLCVITCVYARMALKLWGSRAPGNAQYSRDANLMKNKKKVIKMLFIVVALFAICWLPLQMYNVLQDTFPGINEYRYINIIFFFCDWLAMSNSCYNPFIYGIYNEKFKREFKLRFPGGKRWNQTPNNESYDFDKTQTLRFSNSFRSHVDWRRSQCAQIPMVTYSMHFCSYPYRDFKRSRYMRSNHHNNSEFSEISNGRTNPRSVQYSITDSHNGEIASTKFGKNNKQSNARFCKIIKSDGNSSDANSTVSHPRSPEIKKKSGCFGKNFNKNSDNKSSQSNENTFLEDIILSTKYKNSSEGSVYFESKENRRKSMEFNANYSSAGKSQASASGPYFRGVVVRRPTQRGYLEKWAGAGGEADQVETDIYIFPEGGGPSAREERPPLRLPDDHSL